MVLYIFVSCLFGHYPSFNLNKFTQRFRDWFCLRLQVMKGKGQKEEVILAGGPLRQS
jgi:hypothetical protein